jgi:TPR repeat protein
MRVVADAPDWDLAVLDVEPSRPEAAAWLRPGSPSPTVVAVGGASEEGCEAVGFPDQEVQRPEGIADPGEVVRQSEHLRGTLLPMGQAKPPAAPRPRLPREWMPLDASTATPGEQVGWRGMSGAGVLLGDGRLAGIAVSAEAGHQQRRLYVVPLAPALAQSAQLAAAVAAVVGAPVVAEARSAPRYRRALYRESLAADGTPLRLGEVADLGVFGVKPVDLAGEPTYLNYVPRDDDGRLTSALREAANAGRVLLLVGDSGSGKSRSAAQAVRDVFATHRLLHPVEHQLPQLLDLPLADLGPALVWLDDVEKYTHPALREILERLLDAGAAVIGTIRRKELQALTTTGEIRNPSGETLTNEQLVHRLDWKREWSQPERDRTAQHVTNPVARQAVADGLPLGVWAVAGPQLVNQLNFAHADEDYPSRFALVRAVLDWYRTGLTTPIPQPVAVDLINHAYLNQAANDDDITDAIDWCTHPIDIGGRRARYSLLTCQDDQHLAVNDYIQDHDRQHHPPPVPDPVWSAALAHASDIASTWSVGTTAYEAGHTATALSAMRTLASAGEIVAMVGLGALLQDQDPTAARTWYERAANAGNINAMVGLGLLLQDQDPTEARTWWERAANAGDINAMFGLGLLLEDQNPAAARTWYERAANAGNTGAMVYLGVLVEDQNPAAARTWWERAANAGDTNAMVILGRLLAGLEPPDLDGVHHWWKKAADGGETAAMFNLSPVLAVEGDLEGARVLLRKATDGGMPAAGTYASTLDDDPAVRHAARATLRGLDDDTDALNFLGVAALRAGAHDEARASWMRSLNAGDIVAALLLRICGLA